MKNLVIAILIGVILINCFGHLATNIFGMHLMLDHDLMTPFASSLLAGGIAIVMVIVGFVIALSVFGALALAVFAAFIGLFVAGIGVFWPLILAACIVIWLVKDKPRSV